MPAAALGRPLGRRRCCPSKRDAIPAPIRRALAASTTSPNVYVLGPEQRDLARRSSRAAAGAGGHGEPHRRAARPVENAIAFARYQPGQLRLGRGRARATTSRSPTPTRPLDAAAAAPLATSGVFAPLLLTDDAADLPRAARELPADVQPGYEDDPARRSTTASGSSATTSAISVDAAGAARPRSPS